MQLVRPTKELIVEYASDFMRRQAWAENAIGFLLENFPDNKNYEGVLLKSIAINALYNTQIFAIAAVARHIFALDVDEEMRHGLPEVVDKIARVTIKEKQRNNYSFASKYCSFHNPSAYPIYDSFVHKLLVAYKKQDGFASFKEADLRSYVRFKQILDEFKNFYGLHDVSLKHLDNFLWGYGNERFGRFK